MGFSELVGADLSVLLNENLCAKFASLWHISIKKHELINMSHKIRRR